SVAALPLRDVERELNRQLASAKEPGESPVQRAQMSNLVIFCDRAEMAASLADVLPQVLAAHPARVFLLIGEAAASDQTDKHGDVSVWCQRHRGGPEVWSEQITLRARGTGVDRLA